MASFRDFVGKILVASKRRGTLLASFGSEGSLSMATTVADINCVESGTVDIYHKKVHELTCLMSRSMPYLHRMALRRMGNVADAEDVVQEALLSAYSHVEQFRGQARMSTWLTSIVINSARMRLRRRSWPASVRLDEQVPDAHAFAEILSDSRPNPEEECRRAERAKLLAHSFRTLSPTLRRTFQLRDVDGLSIRETANLLGIPEGTVKARVARARARLKQMLQQSLGATL
jgi:RNA polymerase sigma-70 factor (ECF subfamily)